MAVSDIDQTDRPAAETAQPTTETGWITAEAALGRLGIARQTLYAYVSRGLVRTRPAERDPRRSLYDPRSIDALLERRHRGRARQAVAASTIDFGEPVLASRITRIANGGLLYRGRDAIELATTATLEEVAALLWEAPIFPPLRASGFVPAEPRSPIARCLRRVASLTGPAIWARGAAALHADAAALLRRIAEAACNARAGGAVHTAMARAWGVDAAGADLIRRALVLCADHELNASAFAVRVVASTGAALPACLLAGLAALSGPLHGGMTERIGALLAEPGMLADPRSALAARLDRGERLPGFGHRLYLDGDPRATALLAALDPGPWWRDMFAAAEEMTGQRPNIDTALVALERTLHLPEGSALAIFAAGRTAGWIAHALEQRQDGRLIRPRASYAEAQAPPESHC
jgi:citrate synthase